MDSTIRIFEYVYTTQGVVDQYTEDNMRAIYTFPSLMSTTVDIIDTHTLETKRYRIYETLVLPYVLSYGITPIYRHISISYFD